MSSFDSPASSLQVTVKDGVVAVKGEGLGEHTWHARRVDDKRVILMADEAKIGLPNTAGMASCGAEVFRDFMLSLSASRWSGLVAVDTGYGIKRVFFTKGEIVFAASSIMDDRLGEVLYREAKISLDELTNSAAQVTKARKFGQVLLSSGILTNVELWEALKLQVRQIMRSLFMVERAYFELQDGAGLAPTEVVFTERTPDLISECYSYGCAFRAFLSKLRAESEVVVNISQDELSAKYDPGTFTGDLLQMVTERPNVQELLNTSKLIDNYTVSALLSLVHLGLCRMTPEIELQRVAPPEMAPLKAKIDGYGYVLSQVRKAFIDAGKELPAADIQAFAMSMNPIGFPSLFVDDGGNLNKDCVSGLVSQCVTNVDRIDYFRLRVESLIQFLLQLAGDNLDFGSAKRIRQDYRSVTA